MNSNIFTYYSHLSYKLANKTWFKVQKYKRIYVCNCVVVSFLFNDTQENIPHRIITHQIFCPNNMFSLLIWGKCIYMRIACFFVLLCCNAIMINENLSDRWNSPSTHHTIIKITKNYSDWKIITVEFIFCAWYETSKNLVNTYVE